MHTHTTQKEEVPTIARTGLSSSEARKRLTQYGENSIFHKKRERALIAFIKKFQSPLLILLGFAAVLSIILGQTVSGIIIVVMIFLSAILDFVNSYRSERVAETLAEKIITSVQVYRDGKKVAIPLQHIVPGDLVSLVSGSVIPADGVLVEGDDLFVNQSALTGESFPIGKEPCTEENPETHFSAPSSESVSSIYMGTSVVTGFGVMRVVHTGEKAAFGKIAAQLSADNPETDFDKGIRKFSFLIMRITMIMVSFVFIVNALKPDHAILNSLIFAIAIAVGLTPELLPVIMTVTLSKGSLRMAKKHVVVRTLPAIQNLGAMNVLATDKTGTLTEDHITLVSCVDIEGKDSDNVFLHAYIASIFHTRRTSPLDEAIRTFRTQDTTGYTKVDEVPFDFMRKRDSIVFEKNGERFIITKGAPEELLSICSQVEEGAEHTLLNEAQQKKAQELYATLSAEGYRVLGIAYKKIPSEERTKYTKEDEHAMTFLGFSAFMDPPKATVGLAIQELAELNVDIKIITGDSEVLTERICKDIGLSIEGVLLGTEIEAMSDTALDLVVNKTTIFARVTPEGKERIINALRRAGNVVGYLGDGINDAPALKAADVGISVNNAVDVAKETADIILLTKGLDVLAEGIKEGRTTFQNTMKYVRMGFSSNFGNMASMSVASVALPFLPMLPAQILLNNFMYDLSQTSLPTDTVDKEDLRSPIAWDMRAIKRYMILFGLISSVFDILTFYVLYKTYSLAGGAFQAGWFIESMATQVLVVYIIRTRKLPFIASAPSKPLLATTLGIVILALIIPFSPLAHYLGFEALPFSTLLVLGGIVLVYLAVVEWAKHFYYRWVGEK